MALTRRLRERREEIEQAMLTRVLAVSDLPRLGGPEYGEGLREAVAVALEHGIAAIEHGDQVLPPPPSALLAQARLAATSGVGLDTVLRRYLAGHALLGDFVVEEAERDEALGPTGLKQLLRRLAATTDGLLAAVSAAHAEEVKRRQLGGDHRRAELVERLLAGEPLDTLELGYELAGTHVGLLASGSGADEAIVALARSLDVRLLLLSRDGVVWAWLGRHEAIEVEDLHRHIASTWPSSLPLSLGEPGNGPGGWRLTHRQARAAFPIALRGGRHFVRYRDVALLAAMLQDDLLATSLRRLYLDPLVAERDGGATLRETLRAYFGAERNISSTAAALRVTRNTVTSRLRAIEKHLGRPIGACGPDLEAALRLEEFASQTPPGTPAQSASSPPPR